MRLNVVSGNRHSERLVIRYGAHAPAEHQWPIATSLPSASPREALKHSRIGTVATAGTLPSEIAKIREHVMAGELKGRTIAVLATDGVEQVELTEPVKALKGAGADVKVVSDKKREIQAFRHHDKATKIPVDESLDEAEPEDFDGLVLPGGHQSRCAAPGAESNRFRPPFCAGEKADRSDLPRPLDSDRCRRREGKENDIVAVAEDRSIECRRQVGRRTGGDHADLVTSRKPDDLPAFNKKMIETFSESHVAGK